MSLLFKHLRVHQIFGANTDVGKTLLTTALVRASAALERNVYYLKPASTGPITEADDAYVKRYTDDFRSRVKTHCLFRYDEPVSPHLAALMAASDAPENARPVIPSDETFIGAVASHIRDTAKGLRSRADIYVETAGGVHSPALSGTTQVEAYRPLFLPTILIGDWKLGGISATISAYESLILRGYDVDAIILFRDEYYRNWEYLQNYFGERGVRVDSLPAPPEKHTDAATNLSSTQTYYQQIVPTSKDGTLFEVVAHLDERHVARLRELRTMPRRTLDTIWWPFVQHGIVNEEKDVTVIDSAHGDMFSVFNGHTDTKQRVGTDDRTPSLLEPHFDGSASWWTQALGHAHTPLTLAAARAAGRYGHVMFPQGTHRPALQLAERLVKDGPGKGWASRAFISDNGSTGMEVALKMALRAYAVRDHGSVDERQKQRDLGILGLKGSYHGDTIGAMDACEEGVYTCEWHEAKGFWFDAPTVSIRKGAVTISLPPALADFANASDIAGGSLDNVYNVQARLNTKLAEVYEAFIRKALDGLAERGIPKLAALVLEPIVMGAGGMIFVDPLFQRVLIDVVRSHERLGKPGAATDDWKGLPVIFDEVFTGLYRLGFDRATSVLGVNPDISVHAKILTGGLVPLAVTMASESIFRAFYSDKKVDALLHGHSYTAYPVGCEVANETLSIIDKLSRSDHWAEAKAKWLPQGTDGSCATAKASPWSFWDPSFVNALSHAKVVGEVMTLGTVLAFKIVDDSAGYQSHSAQKVLESVKHAATGTNGASPVPGGGPYAINCRTLGNVAYFMLSLNTPSAMVRAVEDRIWTVVSSA